MGGNDIPTGSSALSGQHGDRGCGKKGAFNRKGGRMAARLSDQVRASLRPFGLVCEEPVGLHEGFPNALEFDLSDSGCALSFLHDA